MNPRGHAIVLLLPSLRTSGGVREAVRLAKDLRENENDVRVVCMWSSPVAERVDGIPVDTLLSTIPAKRDAWKDLPRIAWRLWKYLRILRSESDSQSCSLFATHFSTLPFQLFVSRQWRYVFVQDLEWSFIAEGFAQNCLKRIILFFYRRARLVTANSYLSRSLRDLGLGPVAEASIWASPLFAGSSSSHGARQFDCVMVLRRGAHKRLDLYKDFLRRIRAKGAMKVACITPDDSIAAEVMEWSDQVLIRPTFEEMKRLYSDARIFLLFSEHEGFALPPLEAMGSGCVPVCRDCGGASAYMQGPLAANLLPLSASMDTLEEFALTLSADAGWCAALSLAAQTEFHRGLQEALESRAEAIAFLTHLFLKEAAEG